jgi:predicted DNA-binding ribbon-helix-helix protein
MIVMGILNKRSISINGHKTGIFVENPFWDGLKEIASANKMTLSALVATIDNERTGRNLSSAIRVYVLNYYLTRGIGNPVGSSNSEKQRLADTDTKVDTPA